MVWNSIFTWSTGQFLTCKQKHGELAYPGKNGLTGVILSLHSTSRYELSLSPSCAAKTEKNKLKERKKKLCRVAELSVIV